MFKSKKQVDKHVTDILKKAKIEKERHVRGYCIAKLYYGIKEYETARRYLSEFLSVRENHAPAHRLMGQIFQDLLQYKKSIECYKRSLELDESQKDLVLKLCDLYCQVPVDVDLGRYWAERADKLFPHHATIFKLRESLMKAEGERNVPELENLIVSELAAKPKDMDLRIKLIRLYLDTERVYIAYNHAVKVESLKPFPKSYDWYVCMLDVFEAYMEDEQYTASIEFYVFLLLCCDQLAYLSLSSRSIDDSADILIKFDKYIEDACCKFATTDNSNDEYNLWNEFAIHFKGQLYFQMATFIMKRAKLDQGKWKESCKISAALLMTSLSFKPNLDRKDLKCKRESLNRVVGRWRHGSAYRMSQAGHVMLCMIAKADYGPQQIKQQCASVQMKERIYQRIAGRKFENTKSYFMESQAFCDANYTVLTNDDLWIYDKISCEMDPQNLSLLLWICLQIEESNNVSSETYKCANFAFNKLQDSCNSSVVSSSAAPDTLCQLDTEAFLYATVESAKAARKYRQSVLMVNAERPSCYLPLIIGDVSCTAEQERWWSSACKMIDDKTRGNVAEMRRILQHGLDVIRAYGNHGLSVSLLCHLAQHFITQANDNDLSSTCKSRIDRGVHYWTVSIELLEKLSANLTLRYPKERLFSSNLPELASEEVNKLLDEGRMYIADNAHQNLDYDAALKIFQKVNTADAAFNQALIYKKLAMDIPQNDTDLNEDSVEKRNALLIHARDCCYLTLDRMRGVQNHPIMKRLSTEVQTIENLLLGKAVPEESSSSEEDDVPNVSTISHSTPRARTTKQTMYTAPSPQKLELQIRSLTVGQEEVVKSILEQNKALVQTNRAIVEELKISKSIVDQLKDEMAEIHNELAELRINREKAAEDQRCNPSEEYVDEYIEDSYTGDGSLLYPNPNQYSKINYNDNLYRQEPTRFPPHHISNGYYSPHMGYQSPMLRYPPLNPAAGALPPPHPGLFNHPPYMSAAAAAFGSHFPHAGIPEPGSHLYNMGQPQSPQLPPTSTNIPSSVLTPRNTTPVPPENTAIKTINTSGAVNLSSDKTPAKAAAHPFQIDMPVTAVTPTKSPFGKDTVCEPSTPTDANKSSSSAKEFELGPKSPDFNPIVPLPDKVDVITGEEDEDVQFSGHAKLFRLSESQWKERGVGIVKILLNQQTKKVRLLMRRDQIHRICANHALVAGTSLKVKEGAKLAFTWCAQDFADEEIKLETFCIRFADNDIGNKFKKVFEECVKKYGTTSSSSPATKAQDKPKSGFGDIFKPKPGSWSCGACYTSNDKDSKSCVACQTKRPGAPDSPAADNKNSLLLKQLNTDTPKSTGFTFGLSGSGFNFGTPSNLKPVTNDPKPQFGGFSFSQTPVISTPKAPDAAKKPEVPKDKPAAPSPFAGFTFQASPPKPAEPTKSSPLAAFSFKPSQPVTSNNDATSPALAPKSPNQSGSKEFEPNVTFEPVVPLPDLIEVKSGEEDEEKLFGENSKLYRYDAGQWKERGVGEIKILKHNSANTYRIVMRRDQVLKICANHSITKNMALQPMQNQEKSWIWSAADYSEQEIKNETFAVRFKTKDLALQFKQVFEKCVKGLDEAKPAKKDSAVLQPKTLSEQFKPPAGSWNCDACYSQNDAGSLKCLACQTAKPGAAAPQAKPSLADVFKPAAGSWTCTSCYIVNNSNNTKCIACTALKPGATEQPKVTVDGSTGGSGGFTFGSTGSGGFFNFGTPRTGANASVMNFGAADSTKSQDSGSKFNFSLNSSAPPSFDPKGGFKFGSPENYKFNFDGVKPTSPDAHKRTPKTSESHDEVEPSDADDLTFQPIVPLPPQIQVITGEENENVLYCQRAKLFRISNTEWKERGIGEMKILQDKVTNKIRLLMRREQVLKICLNHYLTPELKFQSKDDRSYMWAATDYAEEEGVVATFALRFKNADIANEFHSTITKYQNKSNTTGASNSESNANSGTAFKFGSGIAKDSKVAEEAKPIFSLNNQVKPSAASVPGGFVFGQAKPIFGNTSITSQGESPDSKENIEIVYEKKATPAQIEKARKLLLPNNFYMYEDNSDCPGCRGCTNDDSKQNNKSEAKSEKSTFQFGNISGSGGMSFAALSKSNQPDGKVEQQNGFGAFSGSGGLSFADLASGGSGFKSVSNSFSFAGAGSKLFSAPEESAKADENDDKGEDNHEPHYEPIVPMPDKVDVVTGEEDEEVLFSERAKLYRFDATAKQWKERGIGNIKVLKHKLKPNLYRILQRREQIHKLSCNHVINSSIDIKPLALSEKAWIWSANDYSENTPSAETFSCKFANEVAAKKFKEAVDECVAALQNNTGAERTAVVQSSTDDKPMFSADVQLTFRNVRGNGEKRVCNGKLEMVVNEEVEGGRLQMVDGKELVCDHMVALSTKLKLADNTANWSALDSSDHDGPVNRSFQAQFNSTADTDRFKQAYAQAKELAEKNQILVEDQFYTGDDDDYDDEYDDDDEDDYEDVDDDDDDDDEEGESSTLFSSRASLYNQVSTNQYEYVGAGDLEITYNDDIFGAHLNMMTDAGKVVCDHMIAIQTTLRCEDKCAYWSAIDSSDPDNPVRKSFRANFMTQEDIDTFYKVFHEGKEFAVHSGIVENEVPM